MDMGVPTGFEGCPLSGFEGCPLSSSKANNISEIGLVSISS